MMERLRLLNMVDNIDQLIRGAPRATCGAFEKELTVRADRLPKVVSRLKSRGYNVIGTSYPKTQIKKVWFVKQGLGSL